MKKKKRSIKQGAAFVVFMLSAAAMDSELYITSGLLAVISITYLWVSTWKDDDDVRSIRGDRIDPRVGGAEPEGKGCHMAEYPQDVIGRRREG